MSRIHINRNRQNLGQFSPEEVAVGLRSGRFFPTDLAWREGMETWLPLSTFTDLPEPPAEEEVPVPSLAPGSDVAAAARPHAVTPAWERPGTWFSRAADTVKEVLASPREAFSGLPVNGEFLKPLTFLLLVGSACSAVSMGYQLIFELVAPRTMAQNPEITPPILIGVVLVIMALLPVILTVASFVSAGIFHLCLMLVGAAPKAFETTFRVVCYANGSTSVMLLIPFCGSIIQSVWNIYLLIVGFREAHGITTTKSVIAVLLPLAFCCGLIAAIGISLGLLVPALSQSAP